MLLPVEIMLGRAMLVVVRRSEGRGVGRDGAGLWGVAEGIVWPLDGHGLGERAVAGAGRGVVQHPGLSKLGRDGRHLARDGVGVAVVGDGVCGTFLFVAQQLLRGRGVRECSGIRPQRLLMMNVLLRT